ncbi:MAG: DUF2497 domain-containing protein [Holosporales bacterium]|jgi:cell pole-organizing protein PopZ|nr:DUF2497 domain-containing protein [Holosporales bacterium]
MRIEGENKDSTVDEILSSIREIMASDSTDSSKIPEDVLVLTDMVQEDGTIVPLSRSDTTEKKVSFPSQKTLTDKNSLDNSRQETQENTVKREGTFHKGRGDAESFLSLIEKNANNLQFEANASERAEFSKTKTPEHPASLERAAYADSSPSALSGKTQKDTLTSLDRLRQTIEHRKYGTLVGNSSGSLEDVVKEALKPLLEDWIEKNLPKIVETIVEHEVRLLTERFTTKD